MWRVGRVVSGPLPRDLAAGGLAGLVAGLVFWWALQAQQMTSTGNGLIGFPLSTPGVGLHLIAAVLVGAVFGGIVRYQPRGYAVSISTGTLYGLLWWIAGPITFGALLDGEWPSWSLVEASNVFPSLIGHLLYGGLTGFGFYLLVALYLLVRPEPEPSVAALERPKHRVVILGGGFGGVSVAKRLDPHFPYG